MTRKRRVSRLALCLLGALVAAGCAGADVRKQETRLSSQTIAKPQRVLVHDFATSASIAPEGSAIRAAQARQASITPNFAPRYTKLGRKITKHLIAKLNERGIPAIPATPGLQPRTGDVLLLGQVVSADRGDRFQRILIGLGSGAVRMHTLAEAYLVVADTLVPLRLSEIEAKGGWMPGMAMTLALGSVIEIAFSGASALASEAGPDSIEAAAKNTAAQITQLMVASYAQRGWR